MRFINIINMGCLGDGESVRNYDMFDGIKSNNMFDSLSYNRTTLSM